MEKIVLIAVGGGVGSAMRYVMSDWAQRLLASGTAAAFPGGTLLVNVLGSLLLGFLACALPAATALPPQYRVAILVGLLGGFTTFSTYAFETFSLINDGQWRLAAVNFLVNNGAALAAVGLGYRLAEKIYGVTT